MACVFIADDKIGESREPSPQNYCTWWRIVSAGEISA
jgi:hypothetical protein